MTRRSFIVIIKNTYYTTHVLHGEAKKACVRGAGGCRMSKYDALWAYIRESNQPKICLSFEAIAQIAGVPLDHSFLKYKAELSG